MEAMAAQTNAAMEKLAKAIGSRPQASMPVAFGSDYPQSGITYVVQSGDTLAKIARKTIQNKVDSRRQQDSRSVEGIAHRR